MAVQYTDGTLGELKPFQDALTDFLQDSEAVSLHKFDNEGEYQKFETKADLQQQIDKLEAKLESLSSKNICSNVLVIPTKEEIKKLMGN